MGVTDTYVSFYSQFTQFAPITALSLFLLTMMRLAPIISLAPFFGSKVPAAVKMGLMVTISVIFFPQMVATSQKFVGFNLEFTLLCVKELFVGLLLAIFVSIPFYIAESSGVTIDFMRGSSSLQVANPITQSQTSDVGVLYNFLAIVIFYEIGGPFYFFNAIADSYLVLPADAWIPATFFQFKHPIWNEVWGLVNRVVAMGIQLAAPSLLAILMTEMFLGIANRLAPQVQIAFLGMSLKSLIGLAMLAAAWFFILQQMNKQTMIWLGELNRLIPTLRI